MLGLCPADTGVGVRCDACWTGGARPGRVRVVQEPVRLVRSDDLAPSDPTPGMERFEAFAVPGLWAGVVVTEPGASSGWHHHGEHSTSLYVVAGRMRLSYGPGGGQEVEAGTGDFLHVPPHTVHREANPGSEASVAVIARAGDGPPTINVDGPEPT